MFSQTATASCPLCKHPSDANAKLNGYPTRLCEKCRSLIETIFPQTIGRTGARLSAPLAPIQEIIDTPVVETPNYATSDLLNIPESPLRMEPAYQEPVEPPAVDEPPFIQTQNDFALVNPLPEEGFYFQELDTPQPSEAVPLLQGNEAAPQFAEPEPAAMPLPVSEQAALPAPEVAPVNYADHAYTNAPAPSPYQEFTQQNGKLVTGSIIDDSPHWNAKMDEWPYLVDGENKKASTAKRIIAVAAIGLLAVLAAGYFLVYKPYFAAPGKNTAQKSTLNQPAQSPTPAGNTEPAAAANISNPAESKSTPSVAPKPEEPQKVEPAPTPEALASGQGQFALQAGVFSSQGNASEFAERLKKAGVPAYTAAAKAGKFRVLVGRFVSSSEAQKFIAQAQSRANSAGIKLELLVSETNP